MGYLSLKVYSKVILYAVVVKQTRVSAGNQTLALMFYLTTNLHRNKIWELSKYKHEISKKNLKRLSTKNEFKSIFCGIIALLYFSLRKNFLCFITEYVQNFRALAKTNLKRERLKDFILIELFGLVILFFSQNQVILNM